MNLRLAVASIGILIGTFFCALAAPRAKFYDGLAFSQSSRDREGRFVRLEPAADGRYRLWLPLAEFSPLLIAATRIEQKEGGRDAAAALAKTLAARSPGEPESEGATFWRQAQLKLAAWRLRLLYGPDELMEAYLNRASYGPAIEGAGAASLIYFGKNPDQLTLTEAMELCVIPDHPVRTTLTGADNAVDRQARRKARKALLRHLAQNQIAAPPGL